MGATGAVKTIVFNFILDKIGATEMNSLIDVEVDKELNEIYFKLEDGSIRSIVVVSAGYDEELKREYYGSNGRSDRKDGS